MKVKLTDVAATASTLVFATENAYVDSQLGQFLPAETGLETFGCLFQAS